MKFESRHFFYEDFQWLSTKRKYLLHPRRMKMGSALKSSVVSEDIPSEKERFDIELIYETAGQYRISMNLFGTYRVEEKDGVKPR